MGMAASQARLLTLTARLHDVEYEAQCIENAKLQLANEEDAVYQEYLDALDATVITGIDYSSGTGVTVTATFNTLCGENSCISTGSYLAYGLVDQETGLLYVTQDMYDRYNDYTGNNDADAFALTQLGYDDAVIQAYLTYKRTGNTSYTNIDTSGCTNTEEDEDGNSYIVGVSALASVASGADYDDSATYYTYDSDSETYTKLSTSDAAALFDASDGFDGSVDLYKTSDDAADTYTDYAVIDTKAISTDLAGDGKYYKNTYAMIQQCGGCIVLDSAYQSDSEWLTNMVNNGVIGIYVLEEDETGDYGYKMEQTSTSTSSILSDTSVSSIDSTALKKAEAEYNKALSKINKKDTRYDTALEELETERTAITTEIDSVRTVIDENIERTFGIFS